MAKTTIQQAVAVAIAGVGAGVAHADTILTETVSVGQLLQSGGGA